MTSLNSWETSYTVMIVYRGVNDDVILFAVCQYCGRFSHIMTSSVTNQCFSGRHIPAKRTSVYIGVHFFIYNVPCLFRYHSKETYKSIKSGFLFVCLFSTSILLVLDAVKRLCSKQRCALDFDVRSIIA